MSRVIIGVMGAGDLATKKDLTDAYQLGKLIAQQNWILLTGGRNVGVMDEASKGAKAAGGLTLGILPGKNKIGMSSYIDLAIITDLGNARNNVNVLSSDVIIACGMGTGTASEVALALKNGKQVVLLSENQNSNSFFQTLSPEQITIVSNPQQAIAAAQKILEGLDIRPLA